MQTVWRNLIVLVLLLEGSTAFCQTYIVSEWGTNISQFRLVDPVFNPATDRPGTRLSANPGFGMSGLIGFEKPFAKRWYASFTLEAGFLASGLSTYFYHPDRPVQLEFSSV